MHTIDCSAASMILEGQPIREEEQIASRFQGELIWSPEKVRLHLDDAQKSRSIRGDTLRRKLAGLPVLPANVLYYLRSQQTIIPSAWRGKTIFFWGSVFRHSEDEAAYVECLAWDGSGWDKCYRMIVDTWAAGDLAAVLEV